MAVLRPNATDQTFLMPGYPFWSLTIIAADIRHRRGIVREWPWSPL
jgi:hypothetical protein